MVRAPVLCAERRLHAADTNVTVAHTTLCNQAPVTSQKLDIANCDTQALATATVSGRRCTPSPLTEAAGLLPVTRTAGHYIAFAAAHGMMPMARSTSAHSGET